VDYTEGLLLGSLWSDTDFENRRHIGLFTLYGILIAVIVVATSFLGMNILDLGNVTFVDKVILAVLMVACPFICFRYYRMPLWGKIIVLIEKLFKCYLVMDITVYLMISRIKVGNDNLQEFLINYLNSTLEKYTTKFQSQAGAFSTVMGVLAGGVHVMLIVVLLVVASIVVPGLIFLVFRFVQFAYDWVVEHLILRKFFHYRK